MHAVHILSIYDFAILQLGPLAFPQLLRLPGHFQAQCFKRRRDQSQNRRSDADGASSSAPSTSLNT